jgi:PBP1b-binding outer membrane lipoprotein LpoB
MKSFLAPSLIALITFAALLCSCATESQAELQKQARVTREQAQKTALAHVKHGTVKSAELEKEKGKLVWSFDIATPGTRNITEVEIDAVTGAYVGTEIETPEQQAREAAEAAKKKAP